MSGDLDRAEELAVRAAKLFEGIGDHHGAAHALLNLATIQRDAHRYPDAFDAATAALHLTVTLEQPIPEAWANTVLASIHCRMGDYDRAADHYRLTLRLTEGDGSRLYETEALTNWTF